MLLLVLQAAETEVLRTREASAVAYSTFLFVTALVEKCWFSLTSFCCYFCTFTSEHPWNNERVQFHFFILYVSSIFYSRRAGAQTAASIFFLYSSALLKKRVPCSAWKRTTWGKAVTWIIFIPINYELHLHNFSHYFSCKWMKMSHATKKGQRESTGLGDWKRIAWHEAILSTGLCATYYVGN